MPDIDEALLLTLPPRLDGVHGASQRVLAWCTLQGVPRATLERIELPLVETLNNAILHGCRGPVKAAVVGIVTRVTGNAVNVAVTDPGHFEPEPGWTNLPADPLATGGRGGFLIGIGTDSFTNRNSAEGHTLSLHWNSQPAAGYGLVAAADLDHTLEHLTADLTNSYETVLGLTYFAGLLATSATFSQLLERVSVRLRSMVAHDQLIIRFIEGTSLVHYPVGTALSVPAALPIDRTTPEGCCVLNRHPGAALSHASLVRADHPGEFTEKSGLLSVEFGGQLLGTLGVTRGAGAQPFTGAEVELLKAVADFVGIARATDHLWLERQHRLQLEQEVRVAAAIQRSLLPAGFPHHNRWWVHGACRPAREIGGDYFDVVDRADGSVLLIIADVMGKGVPASLLAAMLRSSLRAMADLESSPERILTGINRQLYPDLERLGMFITAVLICLPAEGASLPHFANAGHCPPVVIQPDGTLRETHGGSVPLGILPATSYQRYACPMASGDRLLLYTDGCYELNGPDGELWGSASYLRFAASHRQLIPSEFIEALLDHTGLDLPLSPVTDDRTLVVASLRP
jgi:serine phosphatase RsbU (regulator of sigma subunit)/anti-sigma regulatory factor (Ser/Thr protein kinase)